MNKLISFFEIPATNFHRAVRFYESILSLQLAVYECETEKMAFFPEEEGLAPGAISFAADFKPSREGVLVSLSVEDMEDALVKVESNGGQVLRPKTKIQCEGRGYFSIFMDSEGNSLGLYSNR